MTDYQAVIKGLDLDESEKRYLEERWLDQVRWLSGKAAWSQRRYYAFRLTTVVGAVLVPALASGTALSGTEFWGIDLARVSKVAIWIVGVIVAISAAVEQLFHFGERWRNYRRTAERLKSIGWMFFELGPPYAEARNHKAAFPLFVRDAEQVLQADVDAYVSRVTSDPQAGGGQSGQPS
jgi:hypothetical protein